MLLDHGRLLTLPPVDRATFGVDLLKQFMGTQHTELVAAHVNAARALEEWASFKEHVVQKFAKTHVPDVGGLDPGAGACPMGECLACFVIATHILPC